MRRYTILSIVFLISALLLLGCSSDKEDENVASSETEENKEKVEQSSDESANEGKSEAADEEKAEVDAAKEK